ncbi:MAG TPA: pyruvate kinase [Arcobacter sp.]|nr:pyruvate kinase [Arcobacter sp.]
MKKIIATVGPSLLHNVPLEKVHSDSLIYRINGAHGSIEAVEEYILRIKEQANDAKILMDLPGNKVRTADFEYGYIDIEKDKEFEMYFHQFNYKEFYKHLNVGDEVLANDSIFKFEVLAIDNDNKKILFLSHSDGKLLNNKGFHIKGVNKNLPFLFNKDRELIELSNKHNLDFVGLSFVRDANDVQEAKSLIENSQIISKIETLSAVNNLTEILKEVEYILVDRGDLSTDVGLFNVPSYQKFIVEKAIFSNKKVFLATQFLKSMELNPIPTFPEIIDLYNTLKSGIYGLQLSEETAIGKYPKECIDVIFDTFKTIDSETKVI